MGNFTTPDTSAAGAAVTSTMTVGNNTAGPALTAGSTLTFSGGGLSGTVVYTTNSTTATLDDAIADLTGGTATNAGTFSTGTLANLTSAGFTFGTDANNNLTVSNSSGEAFTVTTSAAADGANLGFGANVASSTATSEVSSTTSGGGYELATTNATTGVNSAYNLNFRASGRRRRQPGSHSFGNRCCRQCPSTVTLDSTNSANIDDAINAINQQLQKSNDLTLQGVTAVKVNSGGTEKINFVSTNPKFSVSLGTAGTAGAASTEGIYATPTSAGVTPVIATKEGVTIGAKQVGSGNSIELQPWPGRRPQSPPCPMPSLPWAPHRPPSVKV